MYPEISLPLIIRFVLFHHANEYDFISFCRYSYKRSHRDVEAYYIWNITYAIAKARETESTVLYSLLPSVAQEAHNCPNF